MAKRTPTNAGGLFAQTCKSCGASIAWETTGTGASVPVDLPPQKRYARSNDGKVYLVDTFTPHFATCPNAAEHRKDK